LADGIREVMTPNPRSLESGSTVMEAALLMRDSKTVTTDHQQDLDDERLEVGVTALLLNVSRGGTHTATAVAATELAH
jgi:hypothetical protein